MPEAMVFLLGTQERVRNSRGKRAIGVRATEVLLYMGVCKWSIFANQGNYLNFVPSVRKERSVLSSLGLRNFTYYVCGFLPISFFSETLSDTLGLAGMQNVHLSHYIYIYTKTPKMKTVVVEFAYRVELNMVSFGFTPFSNLVEACCIILFWCFKHFIKAM